MENKYLVKRETSFSGNIHKGDVVSIESVSDKVATISNGYDTDLIMAKDLEKIEVEDNELFEWILLHEFFKLI